MAMRDSLTYDFYFRLAGFGGDKHRFLKKEYTDFRKVLLEFPYGSVRRKKILDYLNDGIEFPINCKYNIQLDKDIDIQKLLKGNKIELFNVHESGGRGFNKRTFVRIKRV